MRIFIFGLGLILFLGHSAIAGPARTEVFPFSEFQWRGETITTLEELHQAMREVAGKMDAADLTAAMATTNRDPDFFLGYAIAEFNSADERARTANMFDLEHPFMGPPQEMERLSFVAKVFLGALIPNGFSLEQIASVRREILELPDDAIQSVLSAMLKRPSVKYDWLRQELFAEACASALRTVPKAPEKKWYN